MKHIIAIALIALTPVVAQADDVSVNFTFQRTIVKADQPNVTQTHVIQRIESQIGDADVWCDRHFFGADNWAAKTVAGREAQGWTTLIASCNGRSE